MATVLYLALDPRRARAIRSAGHPPPLLLARDGERVLSRAARGAAGRRRRRCLPRGVEPRARGRRTLVLYTDGLVERRGEPLDDGLDALARAPPTRRGERARAALRRACSRACSAKGDPGRRGPARGAPRAGGERHPLHAAGRARVAPGLRRRLGALPARARRRRGRAFEITLTVSEAAANAIEHAYGPGDATFDVEARWTRGVVARCAITGRWRDGATPARPRTEDHQGPDGRGGGGVRAPWNRRALRTAPGWDAAA